MSVMAFSVQQTVTVSDSEPRARGEEKKKWERIAGKDGRRCKCPGTPTGEEQTLTAHNFR